MIAIDIGGTYTRYKIGGEVFVLKTKEINLLEFLENLIKKYSPKKIAISFAGQVKNNIIYSSPNTKFEKVDLSEIEKKYNIKIILENDLNCAALAESRYFKAKNLVALYSGTGLGSGITEKGKIVKGRGFGGEIGHIPYKPTPFKCSCGKNNCLEFFASGSGIEKMSKIYNCNGFDCNKVKEEYIKALMYAVGVCFSLFDPEILVLGGGVIVNNPWIVKEVEKRKDKYIPKFNTQKIELTKLKDASLTGAEILLKERK